MEGHTHLADLNSGTIDLLIRVRVTRMWLTTDQAGVVIRHNLIFLDCEVKVYIKCLNSLH